MTGHTGQDTEASEGSLVRLKEKTACAGGWPQQIFRRRPPTGCTWRINEENHTYVCISHATQHGLLKWLLKVLSMAMAFETLNTQLTPVALPFPVGMPVLRTVPTAGAMS